MLGRGVEQRWAPVQVQATFAGGLAEHLQAAGGASAAIAASLRESVSQMNSATDRLNKQVGAHPLQAKLCHHRSV